MALAGVQDTGLQAWRIPDPGRVADETLPDWLVSRLTNGAIRITHLGGLALSDDPTTFGLPGEIVTFESEHIRFCSETAFDRQSTVN